MSFLYWVLKTGHNILGMVLQLLSRGGIIIALFNLPAMLPLKRPTTLLATLAATEHPGSCSVCCPLGCPGTSQQSCVLNSQSPAYIAVRVIPSQGQDLAFVLAEFHNVRGSSFLRSVSVPLKGSSILKRIKTLVTAGLHSTPSKDFKTEG